MKSTRLYFGGIPTGPEVKKLFDVLGIPVAGVLPHERLEEITGLRRGPGRYRTVVGAWRKRLLREYNIAAVGESGVGIRILTEPERVDHARRQLSRNSRAVLRNHRFALMTDASKLDEPTRLKNDHVVRASGAMASAAQITERELVSALRPQPQLPRVSPLGMPA